MHNQDVYKIINNPFKIKALIYQIHPRSNTSRKVKASALAAHDNSSTARRSLKMT
jgi:hypothetical protein